MSSWTWRALQWPSSPLQRWPEPSGGRADRVADGWDGTALRASEEVGRAHPPGKVAELALDDASTAGRRAALALSDRPPAALGSGPDHPLTVYVSP